MRWPVKRPVTQAALVFTGVYAALVALNYVVQTTFVPALVTHGDIADAPLIAAFTMAQPRSLAWGLEMWGYGFLGLATWLVAPVMRTVHEIMERRQLRNLRRRAEAS